MRGALRGLMAGSFLACVEIAVVAVRGRDLFLSSRELGRYALLALLCLPAVCAILGALLALATAVLVRAPRPTEHTTDPPSAFRALRWASGVASAPLVGWMLWSLTAGRRVRDVPGRGLWVALGALAAGLVIARVVAFTARRTRRGEAARGHAIAFALLALCAVIADASVLPRLYPAFHVGLAALACGAALLASALVLPDKRDERAHNVSHLGALLAVVCGAGAALQLSSLSSLPGLRLPIEHAAPLTAKLIERVPLARAQPVSAPAATAASEPASRAPAGPSAGVDLRDRDVLLITIDALRADRLAAYGGRARTTPRLDALAADARVFLRAYTPTPHTSYAVLSMLSGKPLGLLYTLASLREPPVTLPELLRRHGYRTAAFYPPAIFYVDTDRFSALEGGHMGFEYVKAQYGSGQERVEQLRAYLQHTDAQHPLFVWVHLFEPHEPYEPPPAFMPQGDARDDAEALYDGEVRAADAAAGELIALFRAARPAATVIVSADHGEEHGEHGGRFHGTTLFDEQARIPLVWSSPGRVPPGASTAPVELLDVPTTLLAALGIPKDARMQGDDLGAVLADPAAPGPAHAFAALPELTLTTDGRHKAICRTRAASCQLFDLVADPREREDLSVEQPAVLARLQAAFRAFVAQVPRIEALDLSGTAWPPELARARLGDASVVPALTPLLGSPHAVVRAQAAAALGELKALSAKPMLARLLQTERDPEAAAEMAIAALRLGELTVADRVAALLAHEQPIPSPRVRAAAGALAYVGDTRGEAVLVRVAKAAVLAEPDRLQALDALVALGAALAPKRLAPETLEGLGTLLAEVRLRVPVARAFAALGDKRALPALRRALAAETYPDAIDAEAEALRALGDAASAARLGKKRRELLARAASEPAPSP